MSRTGRSKVLIMAGGTGGHVYPALAVAERLRANGNEVIWLGVRQGLEADLVPRAGIPICYVKVSGLRGKGIFTWITAPFRLLVALVQSLLIIGRSRPRVVLGMGGFVAGPGGLAAWLLRRPLLIHEQNAIPGLTNRLLARVAKRVLEAFPGTFAEHYAAVHTGNPLRSELTNIIEPEQRLAGRDGALRLLILGGSQGAVRLNQVVPGAIAGLTERLEIEVRHQSGKRNIADARDAYEACGVRVELTPFIEDMGEAYQWADLVVGRAGAMTVCELAAVGAASILVPFPFAVDDHQRANARLLSDVGAAVVIPEDMLTPDYLGRTLEELYLARDRLMGMAKAARAQAVVDATDRVANLCLETANV